MTNITILSDKQACLGEDYVVEIKSVADAILVYLKHYAGHDSKFKYNYFQDWHLRKNNHGVIKEVKLP